MRIPRAFFDGTASPGDVLELSAREAIHIVRVLRRRVGDRVVLVSHSGDIFDAEIIEAVEGPPLVVKVRVARRADADLPPILPWTLGLALVKSDAFELALRMASELGMLRVTALITCRSIVRPREGLQGFEKKAERWRSIAEDAAKQCGRGAPLEIAGPLTFDSFVRDSVCAKRWIAIPSGPVRLSEIVGAGSELPESEFLLGPEGGFTPREVARAREAAFEPLGLPTPVLRTPTAVALIAALGVLGQGRF